MGCPEQLSSCGLLSTFLGCSGDDWSSPEGVLAFPGSVGEPLSGYCCLIASSNGSFLFSLCRRLSSS